MRSVLALLLAVVIGLALGLSSAFLAVEADTGFNRMTIGPWSGSARTGGVNADPYTKAALVRSGELPLGGGEGMTFTAERDSDGRVLRGDCSYLVEGLPPQARVWTLSLYGTDGRLEENPSQRYAFSSREVLRTADGGIHVAISRHARPGDWLPVEDSRSFRLVMRLYDTPLTTAAGSALPSLPVIRRERCE